MRPPNILILFFAAFSCLNFLGSAFAFDEVAYQEKRPNLFINAGMLFKDHEDLEGGLSEKGVEFLTTIMDSEKFNVVLLDPHVSHSVRLPISINGSPYIDAIRKELPEVSNIRNLMVYSNLDYQDRSKLSDIVDSPNTLIKDSHNLNIDNVFYEIVDLYHNRSDDGYSKGGENPLKNNQDLIRLLFELGIDAFSESFDFDSLKPVLSFKTNPPTCGVSTVTIDLETCLAYIETEYKWKNESIKECGLYPVGSNNLLKNVHSYLCQPQYIIDFEQYVQTNIVASCEGVFECLNSFLNDEAGELINSFHKIILHEKVSNLREKVYSEDDFGYEAQINEIIRELNDFRFQCDRQLREKYLRDYFQRSPEKEESYNEAIDRASRVLSGNLGGILNDDQITEVINKGQNHFNKCLIDQLEINGDSGSFENNGLLRNFKNYLSYCQHNRFFEALKDTGLNLAEDENLIEGILSNLDGICPNKELAFNEDAFSTAVHSFNFEYDAKRCFREMVKKVGEGDLITVPPTLIKFMNLIGSTDPTFKDLGEKYYKICMEQANPQQAQCVNEAKEKAKAEILYKSIVDAGIGSANEDSTIERSEAAMNLFVSKASQDRTIWDCFDNYSGNQGNAQYCRKMAIKHLKPQEHKMIRGQRANNTGEIATAALRDDLADLVTELDREISVFHWGENGFLNGFSEDEPAPLNSVRANNYLRLRHSMFHTGPLWDAIIPGSDNGTNAGRGLYAAADPNSTSRFGDTLFEIRIPEGSRYLDLREKHSQGGIPLSRDTLKKLADAGCELSSKYGSLRESEFVHSSHSQRVIVEKTAFEKKGRCHNIFSNVIDDLEVNFLSYGYEMELPAFCDKTRQQAAAFVMIDIDISGRTTQYNKLTIQNAIKENEENGTPIPEEIKRIMQIIRHPFNGHNKVNPNTSDTEVINYWKERLFLCDGLKKESLGL